MERDAGVRRLIVDGMNVIGSRQDGWWRDRHGAMRRLVEQLRVHAQATGDDVTVVFDGRPFDLPSPKAESGPRVLFAPRRGRNAADDRIVELVSDDPDPGALEVVTSDRELAARVRDAGAKVLPAGTLLRSLEPRS